MKTLGDFITQIVAGLAMLLEREGGYHLVCLSLIVIGVLLLDTGQKAQASRDLIIFGTGVLARSMGSRKTPPPAA